MQQKVLVFGGGGQLGVELCREFARRQWDVHRYDRQSLDVTDSSRVEQAIGSANAQVVINSAAYNQVDIAEQEPLAAYQANALAVRSLAMACRQSGVQFVHYSTDYVFDGAKGSPYVETDAPHPLGAYAVSKLAGELYAQALSFERSDYPYVRRIRPRRHVHTARQLRRAHASARQERQPDPRRPRPLSVSHFCPCHGRADRRPRRKRLKRSVSYGRRRSDLLVPLRQDDLRAGRNFSASSAERRKGVSNGRAPAQILRFKQSEIGSSRHCADAPFTTGSERLSTSA